MAKHTQCVVINSLLVLIICAFSITLFSPSVARAEGFAMSEWSARGMGLAGGMVARADDVSTLAYNAAGITQIPGMSMMFGGAAVTPYGQIKGTRPDGSTVTESTKIASWLPAHGYASYQLNDNVWLGFALFSRFGLGNAYDEDWYGRFNIVDISLLSVSAVPTVAYKFNDMFSASVGIEMMYMQMNQRTRINLGQPGENSSGLDGSGIGFGVHLGLHARLNEQWSAGLTYKSQVVQNIEGESEFDRQIPGTPMQDADLSGSIRMPDSIAFAVAYKPIEDLSIEVGTVWTRWSTYNSLDIDFGSPANNKAINPKKWKDGWNFNASVEYKALDWLTLRAGYWHETAVTNSKHADFGLPINGRDAISLGLGFNWEAWVLDLSYSHLWIYSEDYSRSEAGGVITPAISSAKSQNMHTDIFVVSLSYTF